MVEKLPKNCIPLLDSLAKSLHEDAILGFKVETSKTKNKFILAISVGKTVWHLSISYALLTASKVGRAFYKAWPDFLLRPINFISIDDFCSKFKLDKENIAYAVFDSLKQKMKAELKWCTSSSEGVKIRGQLQHGSLLWSTYYSDVNVKEPSTPYFKSFSEFLVWIDLNVKS